MKEIINDYIIPMILFAIGAGVVVIIAFTAGALASKILMSI